MRSADVLRPLFCSVEINDTGADFESPVIGGPGGDQLTRIPFDSLFDSAQFGGSGSISVQFTDYDALIKSNGQRVEGVTGAIDTVFDYVFVERSDADNDYVLQLRSAGVVDDDFVKDVVMVDFTRPVFSDDSAAACWHSRPSRAAELTAENIRKGFIAKLEAAAPVTGSRARSCWRASRPLATQGLTARRSTRSSQRAGGSARKGSSRTPSRSPRSTGQARGLPVIEFDATMPPI